MPKPWTAAAALALAACAASHPAEVPSSSVAGEAPATSAAPLAAAEKPLTALPYAPALDTASMDRAVDPCDDLYTFSCGGWLKANPIPADQSSWSVYGKLQHENTQLLWGLVEEVSKGGASRSPAQQKVGDYFASCIDEAAAEKAGAEPLQPLLAAIAGLTAKSGLAPLLGKLHVGIGNGKLLFGFTSDQDAGDATQTIAEVFAGGLGLPDRDYYVNDDARSTGMRAAYRAHVIETYRLVGDSPAQAAAQAEAVLRIETALARASLTRTEKRDPHKTYHRMPIAELQKLTPRFSWAEYFAAAGVATDRQLNVTEPAFFQALQDLLDREPLADLQSYLRWHLAAALAPYLSRAFVERNFDFYGRTLNGVKRLAPRWRRCIEWIDRDLGEALGEIYVERAFSPEVKQATLEMVKRIEQAMDERIRGLPWMSPATKKAALAKLHGMRNKVGYPDHWRDYSTYAVERGDLAGNVARGRAFEARRQLAKIGKPLDRGEWGMTPPEVNAYDNPTMNDMNFPAGVLQPPLMDLKLDLAPSYGDTGGTIGHELTHGFDDEGRQFDAEGNLRDWWTPADAKAFSERAGCVIDQYAQVTVVDDIKLNSKLTAGEDIADLGGTIIAWEAWKAATKDQKLEPRDGLTPEQRFFVGFAQWACGDSTAERKRVSALTNPHSPPQARINDVVKNMPEFSQAFSCKAGSKLRKEPVCRVW